MASTPSTRPATARGVSARGRYEHIDALRAVAVLMVVVSHAGLGNVVPGGSGVTIFFAISGFIITHIVLQERERTGRFAVSDFYLRRALKLAPPFLLLILLPTLVYSVWRAVDWSAVLSQTFFAFNWLDIRTDPTVLPGSEVVWSLAIEEQFYIAFALLWLVAVSVRRHLSVLTALGLTIVLGSLAIRLVIVGHLGGDAAHRRVYYGTDTRADGIALGILAAVVFATARRGLMAPRVRAMLSSNAVPVLAAAAYLGSLVVRDPWFRETLRYTVQGVAAAALVLYGLLRTDGRLRTGLGRAAGLRPVQVVGLASYSIYLVHSPLMHLMRPWLTDLPRSAALAVLCVVGTLAGILVWRFVELPVERYKSALMKRRAAARAAHGRRVRTLEPVRRVQAAESA